MESTLAPVQAVGFDQPFSPLALEPFLAALLEEQQRLDTPVARFAEAHECEAPQLTALTTQLIPLSAPGPGEQYAFEVDLDSCTGCKSCVAACHSLNGLDEEETWRDVGLLVGGDRRRPFTQTITTACHHCEDPGCLNGCPVLAYEKDPITGIVRHLDDQCIGCSYCVLKCPYDVPKYSSRLGIVRKCDMCHGRLAHGEAPACAQSCPTQAIRIVTVRTDALRSADRGPRNDSEPSAKPANASTCRASVLQTPSSANLKPASASQTPYSESRNLATSSDTDQSALRNPKSAIGPSPADAPSKIESQGAAAIGRQKSKIPGFLPAAPDPSYTRPTTRYVTARTLPHELFAADAAALRPQPAHWPLVVLLMFMPMAVGCGVADKLLHPATPALAVLSWLSGAAGLAFSVAHLGQPLRAWRIFLGLRRSWLSREAVVFGTWFPLATLYTAARLGWAPATLFGADTHALPSALGLIAAIVGTVGLFCSVMIYADTHREFWRFAHTAPRFFGSAIVLGVASAMASETFAPGVGSGTAILPLALLAAMIAKLGCESQAISPLNGDRDTLTPALKTARLLVGPLRSVNEFRIVCGLVGGLVIPALLALRCCPAWFAWPALAAVLTGEFLERSLFFRAVVAPKMPGVPG